MSLDRLELKRIETRIREPLLPKELETKRLNVPVATIEVSGYPEGYFPLSNKEDGQKANFQEEHYPIKEQIGFVDGKEDIALYRKAFPHGLYGVMMVDTKTRTESSLQEFPPSHRQKFLRNAFLFAQHSENNRLYPSVSWTYDPLTRDRKSGQSKSWFHMHLNAREESFKEEVISKRTPLIANKSKETNRSFIEEYSVVASLVVKDYLESHSSLKCGVLQKPFNIDNIPHTGFFVEGGWRDIDVVALDRDLMRFHVAYKEAYNLIRKIVTTGFTEKWQRPSVDKNRIKEISTIKWLSPETLQILTHFLNRLNSTILESRKDFFINHPRSKITSFLYPLAGPSYGVSITKTEKGKVFVALRPQLFSDSGTAGLFHMFGTTIRVKRGEGVYSNEDLKKKEDFEKSVLRKLQNN